MSDPLSKQATASEIAGAVMSGKVKARPWSKRR